MNETGRSQAAESGDQVLDAVTGEPARFVLDEASNPHPRMLAEALYFRSIQFDSPTANAFWLGYLVAMCGATGCGVVEMHAWLDAHADEVAATPSPLLDGTAVGIRLADA